MENLKAPVRIAQMMTDMNYGGVEMVVMNYYRHIDRSRYQFDFFALEGSEIPQREEIERLGGRVYVVPKYTHLKSYISEVTRLLKDNHYPIVHSQMNALSVFSLYAAKKAGVPIRIAHSHSTAAKGETQKNIVKNLLRPFSKLYSTHLFACSELAGNWLYGKKATYEVINNAIDLFKFSYNSIIRDEVRNELGLNGKFVVGHVGRFCYQKNHDFLIDIFKEIHEKRSDAVLIMAGEGELVQHIKEKVTQLGLLDYVLFLGPRKDPNRLYLAMDVFVFPSRYEGLGMVVIEAQVSGLPCVISKAVPDTAKLLDTTVYVNDELSAKTWAESALHISSVGKRDTYRDEIADAGFDIKKESQKLMASYDQLLQMSSCKKKCISLHNQ